VERWGEERTIWVLEFWILGFGMRPREGPSADRELKAAPTDSFYCVAGGLIRGILFDLRYLVSSCLGPPSAVRGLPSAVRRPRSAVNRQSSEGLPRLDHRNTVHLITAPAT